MSLNAQPAIEGSSSEIRGLRNYLQVLAILQVILLVGLVILYLQINGVPDQTAQRVPFDTSGSQADYLIGPLATSVTDLQAKVDGMATRIDAICAAVAKIEPAAFSPNPCSAP